VGFLVSQLVHIELSGLLVVPSDQAEKEPVVTPDVLEVKKREGSAGGASATNSALIRSGQYRARAFS
jgi:hypothetical protein